ncbi:hypothetical protein AVM02_13555 [Brucella anthropi]
MEFPFHLRTMPDLVTTAGVFRQSPVPVTNDSHLIKFALYPVGIVNKSSLAIEMAFPKMRARANSSVEIIPRGETERRNTIAKWSHKKKN